MPFHPPWAAIQDYDFVFGLFHVKRHFTSTVIKREEVRDRVREVVLYQCDLDQVRACPALRPPDNEPMLRGLLQHPKYHAVVHAPEACNHPADFLHVRRPKTAQDEAFWRQQNSFLRRKSKGVLWWATTVAYRQVHFILDDIDMKAVVKKNQSHHVDSTEQRYFRAEQPRGQAGPGEDKYRVITNSELRWVYRNRSLASVVRLVQFWRQDRPCGPPWDQRKWRKLWAKYQPNSSA